MSRPCCPACGALWHDKPCPGRKKTKPKELGMNGIMLSGIAAGVAFAVGIYIVWFSEVK